jgi:hypothetical protein
MNIPTRFTRDSVAASLKTIFNEPEHFPPPSEAPESASTTIFVVLLNKHSLSPTPHPYEQPGV